MAEFQTIPQDVAGDSTNRHDVINDAKNSCYLLHSCSAGLSLWRGWKIYKRYDVMFAGLALASLYLTVLGFHNITVGVCMPAAESINAVPDLKKKIYRNINQFSEH